MKQFVKIFLGLVMIFILFKTNRVNIEDLRVLFYPIVFFSCLVLMGIILFASSARWRVFLVQQGFELSRVYVFKLTLVGTFFNFFIPGGVGGDAIKAILIAKDHPRQKMKSIFTVVADRILGIFAMTILALMAFCLRLDLLSSEKNLQVVFGLLILIFVTILGAYSGVIGSKFSFSKFPRIQLMIKIIVDYKLTKANFIKSMAFSFVAQIAQIFIFVVVISCFLGRIPALTDIFFAVPIGMMATLIPLTPGGVGVGQTAFFILFSKISDFQPGFGVIGITIIQLFLVLYGLLGSIFFVFMKRKTELFKNETNRV